MKFGRKRILYLNLDFHQSAFNESCCLRWMRKDEAGQILIDQHWSTRHFDAFEWLEDDGKIWYDLPHSADTALIQGLKGSWIMSKHLKLLISIYIFPNNFVFFKYFIGSVHVFVLLHVYVFLWLLYKVFAFCAGQNSN